MVGTNQGQLHTAVLGLAKVSQAAAHRNLCIENQANIQAKVRSVMLDSGLQLLWLKYFQNTNF